VENIFPHYISAANIYILHNWSYPKILCKSTSIDIQFSRYKSFWAWF